MTTDILRDSLGQLNFIFSTVSKLAICLSLITLIWSGRCPLFRELIIRGCPSPSSGEGHPSSKESLTYCITSLMSTPIPGGTKKKNTTRPCAANVILLTTQLVSHLSVGSDLSVQEGSEICGRFWRWENYLLLQLH